MALPGPFFSIIVPTRDRPGVLDRALRSIAGQSCTDHEVIVVDDGSAPEARASTESLVMELGAAFRFIHREMAEPRHGPNVARNAGIAAARGRYITFLDDDDFWCDPEHLAVARAFLESAPQTDVYVANQVARQGETEIVSTWLPHLDRLAARRATASGRAEPFRIARDDLLQPEGIGFVHVNICIARAELVRAMGGFWERAPYEGDLDFFLRLAEAGETFVHRPAVVSVNTLRAASDSAGVSSIDRDAKLLFRMLACQHALLHCRRPGIRRYARLLLAGTQKTLAKHHHAAGAYRSAADFALQAAGSDPSLKWLGIAAYLRLRALAGRSGQAA